MKTSSVIPKAIFEGFLTILLALVTDITVVKIIERLMECYCPLLHASLWGPVDSVTETSRLEEFLDREAQYGYGGFVYVRGSRSVGFVAGGYRRW